MALLCHFFGPPNFLPQLAKKNYTDTFCNSERGALVGRSVQIGEFDTTNPHCKLQRK